jgi:hypothetical protein
MSVVRCEVCRGYYREPAPHACHGLRTADWLRFLDALRHWMTVDPRGRFEVYYARRARHGATGGA